jgi:hypothetical protein
MTASVKLLVYCADWAVKGRIAARAREARNRVLKNWRKGFATTREAAHYLLPEGTLR